MTKKERVLNAINHQEPDRVPFFDLLHHNKAIEYYSGERLTHKNGYEAVYKAASNLFDVTRSIRLPQKEEIVVRSEGSVYQLKEWTNWVIKFPYTDVAGLKKYLRKSIEKMENLNEESYTEKRLDRHKEIQKNWEILFLYGKPPFVYRTII